jgi:hypothetical protein
MGKSVGAWAVTRCKEVDAASTRGLSRERIEIVEDRRVFWMMLQNCMAMRYHPPPPNGRHSWVEMHHPLTMGIRGCPDLTTRVRMTRV